MRQKSSRPRLLQAMIDAFSLPDLRRRLLITLGILVAARFIAHVPLPGVDSAALQDLFDQNGALGMLDLFSGGAMRYFSVAALGVYPYITASIIMTLLTPVIPKLTALSKEGEAGRNKINTITHWLAVPTAALAGYSQLLLLQREGAVAQTEPLAAVAIVLSIVAGTMFMVWLGEQITNYGIGNGISLIIFAGIVAGLPDTIGRGLMASDQFAGLAVYAIMALLTTVLIVIFTEAHRRIPVQYAQTVIRSGKMYRRGGESHIPLRVNSAGMIPLIFASALVMLPGLVASYFMAGSTEDPNFWNTIYNIFSSSASMPGGLVYWGLYFFMTIIFAFFYTMVTFEQQDIPGTLQRQGGFVPGIRPGKMTDQYLSGVIGRITWAGALFLGFVAIMPFIAREVTGIQVIQLSSFGMLIVVGVALDTMKQLEAQLVMRRYEGFIK
ncbi:MAG: preprotein translocase subunit SecY [Dehalococcoides mccartyi]|jgi:preprotein translocase, SecY subunit|uniref:Protein translocase subunit SecY n=4 Tax=root TaxID=1 RepID=A0A0V8M4K1_9CHLR|nr:preprotein translocase subunit SecY [Dehalococcoides mccartyi]AAW40272.1 preprotein translocase, SecY subunit [Dehalococcoides mccartyi 195]AII59179.1 preprotein translocase subunit SecY [Dehalococcoides mccartyi CG4]KSV18696.1 preprotein translocase subunit SecY [Dehalococcoides mccartyi]MBF4482650.1 preprotein translocase subunit SecY [Dehalococcoides mccartyi]MCF7635147.1 preprotein translocase, SecY subunit [Dehalococcoides mccartyi]